MKKNKKYASEYEKIMDYTRKMSFYELDKEGNIIGEDVIFDKDKEEIKTPSHYDNSKGTLYKVALERGWNAYLFDIIKRLERAEKKGVFDEDLDKSIAVIQLWKKERNGI